jgi:hypothetical protein
VSATPEQFADELEAAAEGRRYGVTSDLHNKAAAMIRALSEALEAMLAENGALHVNSINSDSPAEKLARAAIKKATGT